MGIRLGVVMDGQGGRAQRASIAVRSLLAVGLWGLGLAGALASLYVFRGAEAARDLAGLIALFCGQACVAELLGFRCDSASISFPRRLLPRIGFPTLWRRRIALRDISRIDALGERAALFYLTSTERIELVFPGGHSRHIFMRFLAKALEARRQPRRPSVQARQG